MPAKTAIVKRRFDSIGQLADYVAPYWDGDRVSKAFNPTNPCADSESAMTPSEGLRTAQNGGYWPEGAKNLVPVELPLSDILAHDMTMPRIERAVVGFMPNIPAAMLGHPVAMFDTSTSPRPNRLIKIGVHIGKAYNIQQQDTFYRGAAILSVINTLSEAGFNVELTAVWRNKLDGREAHIDTVIKEPDRAWSPDSVAFAFCNDAYQRRLVWECLDVVANTGTATERKKATYLGHNGLGNGLAEKGADFDIYFGYMSNKNRWTKEATFKRITESARDQLAAMVQGVAA